MTVEDSDGINACNEEGAERDRWDGDGDSVYMGLSNMMGAHIVGRVVCGCAVNGAGFLWSPLAIVVLLLTVLKNPFVV